jgi:thiol-disulfide isomerase/thioredoxin
MKQVSLLFSASLCLLQATAQTGNTFEIQGRLKGQDTGYVYLSYQTSKDKYTLDSAAVREGRFSFKGPIAAPAMAYLSLKEQKRDEHHAVNFFIGPAVIKISVAMEDFRNAVVTGSRWQADLDELNKAKAGLNKEREPFSKAFNQKNEEYIAAMRAKKEERVLDSLKAQATEAREKLEPFSERSVQIDYTFFAKHPQSYVTAYQLRFYTGRLTADSLQWYYNNLGAPLQQSMYGQILAEEITRLRNGSPGSMATNFSGTDINRQPLNLADYKGKYVLLDFWASWCVPCRKGNPHLLQVYERYRSKGFEIIGVSDDDSKPDAWKKAVEKDGIGGWKHVLRGLKRTANGGYDKSEDRSEAYGIHTLPTKILIDPTGKIIGRYGGGGENEEAMDAKLATLFNNQ